MRRLRILAWLGLLMALVGLAFGQTAIYTKTNSQPWHWTYNGLNLTETAYWRVLAYPENEDTTGNAQDTLAYLATAYDTTWTHDAVDYDSYLYVAYNDTLGISLVLRENFMFPGPEAPLGFIHSMTAFDASVVPPSALNPDSTYDGLRRVDADTLGAVDILLALLAEIAKVRGDTLSALDSTAIRVTSPVALDTTLTIGPYTLPDVDGPANSVLKTNGAGVVSWTPDATGAGGAAYAESLETADGRWDADRYLNSSGDLDTTNIADTEFQAYIEAHNPGAGGTMHTVKENDAVVEAEVHILDFLGADFDVTETPEGEVNIVSAAGITRDSEWDSAAEINAATTDADFVITEVGDISAVTAGTALGGGGTTGALTVNLLMDVAGGLEAGDDDSAGVKLDGGSLTSSAAGLKVTDGTYLPLGDAADSALAAVNRASETDVDTTNASPNWEAYIQGHQSAVPPGAGTIFAVSEGDVELDATVDTLDYAAADFDLTESPENEANIAISAAIMRGAAFAESLAAQPETLDIGVQIPAPAGMAGEYPFFRADSELYPTGITIILLSITLPADAAYALPFEEWAGDPPVAQGDCETVTTTGTDAYMKVVSPDIDNASIDADDYVFVHLPATDVPYVFVRMLYTKN